MLIFIHRLIALGFRGRACGCCHFFLELFSEKKDLGKEIVPSFRCLTIQRQSLWVLSLFSEKKDLGKEIVPSFGCFTKLTKMPLEMHDDPLVLRTCN